MGKTNKGQRTKGNTRPSSSGHTAQLLSSSGKVLSGFIGFEALEKEIPSYVPVAGQHTIDAVDSSVDSDFRMVMRKMLKRDVVTRLKAVQEFGNHCAEKDKDVVKNVLPFWPRLFNKLALDTDRRIREATHEANGKLILKVKREVAPYLKNIMGVWLLGQCDLYAPAASSAQATFTATFPSGKQSEALMFCKTEIFAYFKDNLFEQTAKTMSEANLTSAEDVENKYVLVISATLQALKLFLTTILPSELQNIHEDLHSVVVESKFWKYAKNKEPLIRSAWYSLISCLCRVKHDVFAEIEKKLVTAIFSCLSESDPVVAPSVWEAALHIIVKFENCWEGINIHKIVFPQLWTLLKQGGRGNAHLLFPCLLPFLSKFPKEVVEEESFLLQFLSCLTQSLKLEGVRTSPMECDAILTTFMECLTYICFIRFDKKKFAPEFLEKVIISQIIPTVDSSFYDTESIHIAASKFYPLLGDLIKKTEQKILSENEENSANYAKCLQVFWDNIINILCKIFEEEMKEKCRVSTYIAYFFNAMFSSSTVMRNKKPKVKFQDEEKTDQNECSVVSNKKTVVAIGTSFTRKNQSFQSILRLYKILYSKINAECNVCYLRIFGELVASTINKELFNEFVSTHIVPNDDEKLSVIFCKEVILKWAVACEGDYACISSIVDIIFCIFCCVTEEEAVKILNSCCEAKNIVLLENILNKGLESSAENDRFEEWLKSSVLSETVLNILKETRAALDGITKNDDCISQRNVLGIYLTAKYSKDPLVDKNNVEKFLCALKDFIDSKDIVDLSYHVINFICDISSKIFRNSKLCWKFSTTDDLLSLLFRISMNAFKHQNSDMFSENLKQTILAGIQSFAEIRSEYLQNGSFILQAANELHNTTLSVKSSEEASEVLQHSSFLLSSMNDAMSLHKPDIHYSSLVLSELLESVLPSEEEWNKMKHNLTLTLMPSILKGKIFYPLDKEENTYCSSNKDQSLLFVSEVISSIFVNLIENSSSEESEAFFEQYIMKHTSELLWCLSFASEHEMETHVDKLSTNCYKILSFLHVEKIQELVNILFYSSLAEGIYWALPFQYLLEILETVYSSHFLPQFPEMICKANKYDSDNKYITIQILLYYTEQRQKIWCLSHLVQELSEMEIESAVGILGEISQLCCCLQGIESIPPEMRSLLVDTFNKIVNMKVVEEERFLHSMQMTAILSSILKCDPSLINKEDLNFFVEHLISLLKGAKDWKYEKPIDLLFLQHLTSVFIAISSYIFMHNEKNPEKSLQLTSDTWKHAENENIYQEFIFFVLRVAVIVKKMNLSSKLFKAVVSRLLEAVKFIPEKHLSDMLLYHSLKNVELQGKDIEDSTALDCLISCLASNVRELQLASHVMLMKVMPVLPTLISNAQKSEEDDDSEYEAKIPDKLLSLIQLLNFTNEIMQSMLSDIRIGDCCTVLPCTDSYTFAMTYLLAWLEILEFISSSPSQIRSEYAAHLEENKLLSCLFSNVFCLMPDNPLAIMRTDSTPTKKELKSLFLHPPSLTSGDPSSEEIQIFACYLFATALRRVPASVRTWWNNLDKRSADLVNRFTSKYISGILCAEEIQAVHDNEVKFENMMVRARPGSREVIATYTIDDTAIELSVQLPANYPLGPISAERRGKIVVAIQEWRNWLMQLTTVLTYQNGSILDGLTIWKKNLDKKFEGVEECMICYYILHSSSLKLPKLSCHVCRKKFHSACLYKWFRTSNNFTCPLCRNEFAM